MPDVKVPPLLHKRSVSAQKAWYKQNNMPLPGHLTGAEGKSAAQAKKDVGDINKEKAKAERLKTIAAAAKKIIKPSSQRVRDMRSNADRFGGGLGGGLETNRDIVSYVRAGGTIKAGRLGEEADYSKLPPSEAARRRMDDKIKQAHKDRVERAEKAVERYKKGQVPANDIKEDAEQVDEVSNADLRKTNAYKSAMAKIKQGRLAREYGKKGEDQGMNPSADIKMPSKNQHVKVDHRTGEVVHTYREEVEQVEEAATQPSDKEIRMARGIAFGKRYKGGNMTAATNAIEKIRTGLSDHPKVAAALRSANEEKEMSHGKKLAKKVMANQSLHPIAQRMGEEVVVEAQDPEYDYEGEMAKTQLKGILMHAQKLHDMLEDETNLPEWVQAKITLASDYVQTAADYMQAQDDKDLDESSKVDEKYMGFKAVEKAVAAKGARDPGAVAAAIGRKKYGKEKFQAMAAAGKKKANEEVVVEGSEGKTPETETEVNLAKKHGDPKKITYGDVIKARIQSAKEKALKKGE